MKTKKLIIGSLLFLVITVAFACMNNTKAASGLGYLKIVRDRTAIEKYEPVLADTEGPYTVVYRHQINKNNTNLTKNVWKIVTSTETGDITNQVPDLYCLRAGLGFTNENGSADNSDPVLYDQAFDIDGLDKANVQENGYKRIQNYLSATSKITIFKEEEKANFNSVLWILDHMLLEDATEEEVKAYLIEYAGYRESDFTNKPLSILSKADIDAVQQLAIWYFTNTEVEEGYHNENFTTLFVSMNSAESLYNTNGEYIGFSGRFNVPNEFGDTQRYGTWRQDAAKTLYTNLITAKGLRTTGTNNIPVNVNGLYEPVREITVYLAGEGEAEEQQPVVQIREKQADISLRKFITKIDNAKGTTLLDGANSRVPDVDTTNFNKVVNEKLQTTAIYNHPKKPVTVKIGDIVTYTIRLYNEGEVPAYVKEVKDYLPEYLKYVDDNDEMAGFWGLDASSYIATSTEYCQIVGAGGLLDFKTIQDKTLQNVLIPAAKKNINATDSKESYILSYVDIQIQCEVTQNAVSEIAMTNIAEVTVMTDKDGNVLVDRDSNIGIDPGNGNVKLPPNIEFPSLPDYKSEEADRLAYVPGQEDDDDFDKVIIKNPGVDLALRKFISSIGDTEYNRTPQVDLSGLEVGTTAIYNHSKKPVKVNVRRNC